MRTNAARFAVMALLVLMLPLHAWGTEPLRLKYQYSLYNDEKGTGFNQPGGVACTADRLVVADSGNGRLILYTLEGGEAQMGKELKIPQLIEPTRVAISSKGDIFVLDERQHKIARLSSAGAFQQYVDLGAVPTESMIMPESIALDRDDNLYVLDILGARVLRFDAAGKFVKQVDLPKQYGFITDLTVDAKGTIYLVDAVNAVVYSTAADPAAFSQISKPLKDDLRFGTNITVDSKGMLYISDQNSGGIVVFGQDGSFRNRVLSLGWKEGFLRYPSQICVEADGSVFVADRANNRVQMFTPVE